MNPLEPNTDQGPEEEKSPTLQTPAKKKPSGSKRKQTTQAEKDKLKADYPDPPKSNDFEIIVKKNRTTKR